jgi:medium-chain acyl-[acyl-carrier-protein] hydrolase
MTVEKIWREEFKVHSYEIGPSGYVTPQSLCRFLQEVASNHADNLGVSGEAQQETGLFWVLSQLSLEMNVYPKWHESMFVETWPVRNERVGIRGQRDFKIFDPNENLIGRASTIWLLLNVETRRPTRIPRELNEHASEGLIDPPLREVVASDVNSDAIEKLEFKIRGSDIDWNMHVNNVCYLDWALETVPAQFRLTHKVAQLDVMHLAESKYGSEVLAERFAQNDEKTYTHRITDARTGTVLSLLRTSWTAK